VDSELAGICHVDRYFHHYWILAENRSEAKSLKLFIASAFAELLLWILRKNIKGGWDYAEMRILCIFLRIQCMDESRQL
jgi:hypothetical protein